MDTANRNRKKLALFIGNNAYEKGDLKCCINDAHDLSNKFQSMGFTTTVETDANFFKMRQTIDDFVDRISSNDLVVFFFAGHGLQWNDQNYLLPIDTNRITKKEHLKDRAINAQSTLNLMSTMEPYAIVFILDCCRDYCIENEALRGARTRGGTQSQTGLANMSAPAGSLVAFACAPGETTEDVAMNGLNGLFTFHLLEHIAKPNVSVEDILCDVCNGVVTETDGRQTPHRVSSFRYRNISLNTVDVHFDTSLIKSGTKFGGTGGGPFDDSSMRNFTPLHYLRGMITGYDTIALAWCQFLYSSPDNSENILESAVHGTLSTSDAIERFVLTRNERINKVEIVVDNEILYVNNIRRSVPLIRGVRLFTTEGRQSQSINHIEGERFTEQFDRHAVRYVTGRKGLYIDQLQFHWVPELIRSSDIGTDAKWIQDGVTVAGGNGTGNQLNQISYPSGLYVDNAETVYVTEWNNHRIVEWMRGAASGQVVAGGNGQGNRMDQLNCPTDMIVDKQRDCLIICDRGNKRVVCWPRRGGTEGQAIISNIDCNGLAIDDDGSLYVSNTADNDVKRWRVGDTTGTVVAGGNGKGEHLDQLNDPYYIFVDQDHSVYVSDNKNHRVMKWMKGKKEGSIVAGGQGRGNDVTQLSDPLGVIVDQSGTVYVSDAENARIIRWRKDDTQGKVIVGGNGEGKQPNQLNRPNGLSFDQHGNLYVAEENNHRVQKFNIDTNSSL